MNMPIIRPEISCHPEDLLVMLPAHVPHRRWIVVQTLARQEKSLGRDLVRRDVPFYLPLLSRRLNYRGRKAISYVPLFSSTLFCFANEAERRVCFDTHRVVSIAEVADQSGLQNDLRRIAKALCADGRGDLPDNEWLLRRIRMTEPEQPSVLRLVPTQ
jgi:hypothetical protein